MRKTYVLDTNVLISDPESLWAFDDNDVVLPMVVIEELDKLKNRQDIGHYARIVSRSIDKLRELGNLSSGVPLRNGGTLRISTLPEGFMVNMPVELRDSSVPDNVILATALYMSAISLENDMPCILVSKDVNVRIKCDAVGVKCQDYLNNRVTMDKEQFYRGVDTFDDPKWSTLIEELYAHSPKDPIDLPKEMLEERPLYPNQILVIKDGGQSSIITRVLQYDSGAWAIERLTEYKDVMGLKPRNKEQNFVLNLLLDPKLSLVTLVGKAGVGKTLVALAGGLDQLNAFGSNPRYEKLIVTRPIQSVGKDLGYLPGNLQEKMDPWISPIKDNLNFLMGYKKPKEGVQRVRRNQDPNSSASSTDVEPYIAMLMDSHKIEIEAIPYIRGRSIPNSYIIIDEAQNLSIHELKTIITRSGEGTKVVLLGDVEQIDHPLLDIYTNGLSHAVEKFKSSNISGHITLLKGERSALATLASKIL